MWEKPTDDLGEELMSADSIDTYLHDKSDRSHVVL